MRRVQQHCRSDADPFPERAHHGQVRRDSSRPRARGHPQVVGSEVRKMSEHEANKLEWAGVIKQDRERLAQFMRDSADRVLNAEDKQYIKDELARIAMVLASFEKKYYGGGS